MTSTIDGRSGKFDQAAAFERYRLQVAVSWKMDEFQRTTISAIEDTLRRMQAGGANATVRTSL